MSIIQTVRDKYLWVVSVAIALSVIGFLLMDAGKGGGGGDLVKESDAIGKVNGNKISWGEFNETVKQMEDRQAQQGQVVDEAMRQQIYAQTWNMMVENTVMNAELEKLGLQVSDKEFSDMLYGKNPPADFKQAFTDPSTGEYDVAAAKQFLAQKKKEKGEAKKQIEEYFAALVEQKNKQKYASLLQHSVYVPTWMAEKNIADNSSIASFSFVAVPYSTVADSTIKITDAQINAYVQAHKSEFKQDEPTRNIAYASFSFAPSAEDTAATYKAVESLVDDFKASPDPAAFVARNASSLPFYDGYNSQARIQIAGKDSIIAAGVGNVYGPYLDGGSYVISRIVDSKVLPDSAKVRHILISLTDERGQQKFTDSAASKLADSLLTAINTGSDFSLLALMYSDDPGSKEKGGVYDFFPQGTMVKEFNDFSFEKPKGTKGIVRTQFGYHITEVLDQKNFVPAYKIAYMAKAIEPSQETINDAQNRANIFYSKSKDAKAFDATITKENLNKLLAFDIKSNDYQIQQGFGNRSLVKQIFEHDPGTVLEPVELENEFVVVAITGSEKAGLLSAAKARPQVEILLKNQEKAKAIIAKIGKVNTLEELAQAQGVTVQRADSISFVSPMIPGAGYEPKVAGYAFGKAAQNKISPAIGGSSAVYVIKPDAIGARVEVGPSVEETQKNLVMQQKQSAVYSSSQALRNAAKIEDKRSKFF